MATIKDNEQQNVCGESRSLIELLKEISNDLKNFSSQHVSMPSGSGHVNNLEIEDLMQDIKDEIEVKVKKHEIQSEYKRQKIKRDTLRMELFRLKEESQFAGQEIFSDCLETISTSTTNLRIAALENRLAILTSKLIVMQSKLSEVVEDEQMLSGGDRWNQIHSLAEAKIMLNRLFDLASLSSCQLRDKEVILKENDLLISGYEEYISKLNNQVIQLEAQKIEQNEINIKIPQKFKALNIEGESSGAVEAEMDALDSEDMLKKNFVEDEVILSGKDDHISCSCTRNSGCKTSLCECRSNKKLCTSHCSCSSKKCTNREDFYKVS